MQTNQADQIQVVHPTNPCPAKFVETFRKVLENTNWDSNREQFICRIIEELDLTFYNEIRIQIWIREQIMGNFTFTGWIIDYHEDKYWMCEKLSFRYFDLYSNRCRKAWLEFLVAGHEKQ